MQQNSSGATQNPQQQDGKRARRRLRDSCNSCALSKVKCNRKQPACERCEDRGIYCHYSPSRRTGKRRATTATTPSSGTQGQSQLPAGLITPSEESFNVYDFDFADFNKDLDSQTLLDMSGGLKTPTLAGGDSVIRWDDPLFAGIVNDIENDSSDFQYFSSPAISHNEQKTVQDPAQLEQVFTVPPPNSSDGSASASDRTGFSETDAGEKEQGQGSLEGFKRLFDILAQGSNTPSTISTKFQQCKGTLSGEDNATGIPRDCMSTALDALQNLHRPQSTCIIACDGDGESQATRTLEIDDVLATNKEIIDSIVRTLKCSCSRDTELALILTVIAFKVISWYSAVARSDEAPSGSANNASKPAAERVSDMPITVGKYNLDRDDKVRTRAQIALSELHRMVRLIELLSKSFGQVGQDIRMVGLEERDDNDVYLEASGREAQNPPPPIGDVLMTFLRSRIRSATNETMGILKESQQLQMHCF